VLNAAILVHYYHFIFPSSKLDENSIYPPAQTDIASLSYIALHKKLNQGK